MRSHTTRYPVPPRVWSVGTSVATVDARTSPYKGIKPGDIIELAAGTHTPINFKNIIGTGMRPIKIRNASDGQAIINTASGWYGFWFQNCRHFRFTGTGSTDEYGIEVVRSQTNGVIFQNKTEYFEFDHLQFDRIDTFLANIAIQGQTTYTAAADYDYNGDGSIDASDGNVERSNYKQHNFYIHHCLMDGGLGTDLIYVAIYVGNSNWHNDTDQPEVEGCVIHDVHCENIYHKVIQFGSVVSGLDVHHNTIINGATGGVYGAGEDPVGINSNPGCKGKIHHNWVQDTLGTGINHRGQGVIIYDNVIVDVGDPGTYFDAAISCQPAISTSEDINVFNNTLINPAGNGVEFGSEADGANRVQNNIIVNPGDSYVDGATVDSNNYKTMDIDDLDFTDYSSDDYSLTDVSPARNAGADLSSYGIDVDYDGVARPKGAAYDEGAYEYVE